MDPLANLHDIHLPEAVHHWPISYGWWLLLLIFVVLCTWAIRSTINKRRLLKAKHHALTTLANDELTAEQIISTLKWACIQYFPRGQVANLHGTALASFMKRHLPVNKQSLIDEDMEALLNLHYQGGDNPQQVSLLKQHVTYWLTYAIPLKSTNTNEEVR